MAFKDIFKEIDYKYIFCVVFMKAVVPMVIRALGISADKLGEVIDDWMVSTFSGPKSVQQDAVATTSSDLQTNSRNELHSGNEIAELHAQNYSLVE